VDNKVTCRTIFYAEFHQNRTTNMERSGRHSFAPSNKARLSLGQPSRNSAVHTTSYKVLLYWIWWKSVYGLVTDTRIWTDGRMWSPRKKLLRSACSFRRYCRGLCRTQASLSSSTACSSTLSSSTSVVQRAYSVKQWHQGGNGSTVSGYHSHRQEFTNVHVKISSGFILVLINNAQTELIPSRQSQL